ncbi:MAG: hypoxanthine phosphoribosyltransferase [Alphaproteobacteria bacterium]|nr:hypoxanthine phosphoribosyltransferase [Alphaproteobacteria bacterium]
MIQPAVPTELFSAAAITRRVEELGREVAAALPSDFSVAVILKGGFMFSADLIRRIGRAGAHPRVDFLTLDSYGERTESSGQVVVRQDLSDQFAGRTVLIIDDILESGRTLSFARDHLRTRGAADIKLCVPLDKPRRREVEFDAYFVGFDCPEVFVVGYGLDHAHRYRELPYIGVLPLSPG